MREEARDRTRGIASVRGAWNARGRFTPGLVVVREVPGESGLMLFRDRAEAGKRLASELVRRLPQVRNEDPLVLAIPRGGVPVGYEVARSIDAPLDLFIARKLGAPGHEELGIGAVAPGGTRFLDEDAIRMLDVSDAYVEEVTRKELAELERRLRRFRRSEEHTSELQSRLHLVCRLLLEKNNFVHCAQTRDGGDHTSRALRGPLRELTRFLVSAGAFWCRAALVGAGRRVGVLSFLVLRLA